MAGRLGLSLVYRDGQCCSHFRSEGICGTGNGQSLGLMDSVPGSTTNLLCDPGQVLFPPLWASVSSSVKWGEFCLCLPVVGSIYQIRFEMLGTSKQIRNGHHVAFIYFLCVVHFYRGEFRAFKSHLCDSEWGECCCALQKVLSTAEFQLMTWEFTAALLLQVYPTLYSKSVPEKCLHHVIS